MSTNRPIRLGAGLLALAMAFAPVAADARWGGGGFRGGYRGGGYRGGYRGGGGGAVLGGALLGLGAGALLGGAIANRGYAPPPPVYYAPPPTVGYGPPPGAYY